MIKELLTACRILWADIILGWAVKMMPEESKERQALCKAVIIYGALRKEIPGSHDLKL